MSSVAVGDHGGMADRYRRRPAGIVAFVFTDLEDYTQLSETDPAGMRAALARHVGLIDDAIRRHHGIRAVEQSAADRTVSAFDRASDALAAALDMQVAMHAVQWKAPGPLRLRVAVHTGEVDVDAGGAYSGPTMTSRQRSTPGGPRRPDTRVVIGHGARAIVDCR